MGYFVCKGGGWFFFFLIDACLFCFLESVCAYFKNSLISIHADRHGIRHWCDPGFEPRPPGLSTLCLISYRHILQSEVGWFISSITEEEIVHTYCVQAPLLLYSLSFERSQREKTGADFICVGLTREKRRQKPHLICLQTLFMSLLGPQQLLDLTLRIAPADWNLFWISSPCLSFPRSLQLLVWLPRRFNWGTSAYHEIKTTFYLNLSLSLSYSRVYLHKNDSQVY